MTDTITLPASQGLISADSGEPTGAGTPADALGEPKRMSANDAESQESYECPTCGRDDFANQRAMRYHHATVHGESLSKKTIECDYCGEAFERPEWLRNKNGHNLCSDECRKEWRSEKFSGKGHPRYNRVERQCPECGEVREYCQSRAEGRDHIYCSRKCVRQSKGWSGYDKEPSDLDPDKIQRLYWEAGNSQREIAQEMDTDRSIVRRAFEIYDIDTRNRTPPELKSEGWLREKYWGEWEDQESIAEELACGTGTVSKWMREHSIPRRPPGNDHPKKLEDEGWLRTQYIVNQRSGPEIAQELGVSHASVYDYMEKHSIRRRDADEYTPTGEDHWNWKDTATKEYGPGWQRRRREILERDEYQCRDCGVDNSTHLDKHGTGLHIHHINPRSNFISENGDYDAERANDPDNLITLCNPCHNKWEKISPLRFVLN